MIKAHAGRGDAKHVRRAPIEKGVEFDLQVLGLRTIVATAHGRLNPAGTPGQPGADIERRVVVGEPHLHPVGLRGAFVRFGLEKIDERLRPLPDRFVETTVDPNRSGFDASRLSLLARRLGCCLPGGRLLAGPGQGSGAKQAQHGQENEESLHGFEEEERGPVMLARSIPEKLEHADGRDGHGVRAQGASAKRNDAQPAILCGGTFRGVPSTLRANDQRHSGRDSLGSEACERLRVGASGLHEHQPQVGRRLVEPRVEGEGRKDFRKNRSA